ncbi:hypothetical protein [Xanthobacter autotrophicus]
MGDLAVGFDEGGRINWGVYGDRANRSNYGGEYDAGTSAAREWSGVT